MKDWEKFWAQYHQVLSILKELEKTAKSLEARDTVRDAIEKALVTLDDAITIW